MDVGTSEQSGQKQMKSEIQETIKNAMKEQRVLELATNRTILSRIQGWEKDNPNLELNEQSFQNIVKKLAKQSAESLEAFENANREDLIVEERAKLKILESYLPQMLTDEQTHEACLHASQQADNIGERMKWLRDNYGTVIDMKKASEIIRNLQS